MSLSSTVVPMRLLWPVVVRFVVVVKRHFLFWVSSRFWSEKRCSENSVFYKHFLCNKTVPNVPLENVPKVEQNKQRSNTRLRQEVAVTVTQAKHEAMSTNSGHKSLTIITSVTRLKLDSIITRQIRKQQYSHSLRKRIATLKHKLILTQIFNKLPAITMSGLDKC